MTLLVFVGTKAQYIKTAPILLELDRRRVEYRLIYTGQHSETFSDLEAGFGTRPADECWVPNHEADTHTTFFQWSLRFWLRAWRWRMQGGHRSASMVLVHGDTASTLYCAALARICGLPVCHVEAGLRSQSLTDPFPEEIIRRIVSRLTSLHCAPSADAVGNLAGVRGRVVDSHGNTLIDALGVSLQRVDESPRTPDYAVVSMHRNENLSNRRDFDMLMSQILEAARTVPIRFVLHPATRAKLASTGWGERLNACPGITLLARMGHSEFLDLLVGSNFLLTDGGSNQEEAAVLGIPCLLLRRHTERPDGIGDMVELSGLDPDVIQRFIARHAAKRWVRRPIPSVSPSRRIVDALVGLPANQEG
ncbi:UDP-N-acetylglucosamine 2-epimerase [Lysobacter arenosi]|uniref:UDP-N-acetylglucosamine 2-epimerase n=1 Tax=Lysobacter arenosi TaxID=2795387 RepID=A0ABX7R604_9GAMM|nr:UDP-N-acetylglucosamine 2-epimerase [Lysobacter arenosi]QSX73550.1 UDP-N-acetylglucosamine 2-epimerase [Lysobacter arenosi]